ncbi:Succinyl-CoA ligase [ADP-forming] subunit alpha [Paludisphaera borealis]|uniref:Succinyl-CoA ligase [ADP-forming] subunit alpha n=1 Tax=Paludisphaera borealis TaxID=1387353 RepID=A0A1U7CNN9_9BACT|nr:Succinyl-CoA ligase [ADP-forming] subunit alpha [Paludisphaera borealis]
MTRALCSPDLTRDVPQSGAARLDSIFVLRTVALIGVTERAGNMGRTVIESLAGSPLGESVFPVNLNRPSVLGLKSHPSIGAVLRWVDLAVIATPAPTVPDLVGACVESVGRGVVILSAGFEESGLEGAALERRVAEQARRGRMRIVEPNCLGVMNPWNGLDATLASATARPGSIGFLSQSGTLCTAVLDWSLRANVGFSAFVSVGSMLDVGWGDLIDHLGDDPRTESILIYMESVGDARSFLSAAREVALAKPIIVLKAGRTQAAAAAAAAHTWGLTGSDEVLDAAFRRCTVLRVDRIAELFSMAGVLGLQLRPRGPWLTILTNAGGGRRPDRRFSYRLRRRAEPAFLRDKGGTRPGSAAQLESRQPDRSARRRRPRPLRRGAEGRHEGP